MTEEVKLHKSITLEAS